MSGKMIIRGRRAGKTTAVINELTSRIEELDKKNSELSSELDKINGQLWLERNKPCPHPRNSLRSSLGVEQCTRCGKFWD